MIPWKKIYWIWYAKTTDHKQMGDTHTEKYTNKFLHHFGLTVGWVIVTFFHMCHISDSQVNGHVHRMGYQKQKQNYTMKMRLFFCLVWMCVCVCYLQQMWISRIYKFFTLVKGENDEK